METGSPGSARRSSGSGLSALGFLVALGISAPQSHAQLPHVATSSESDLKSAFLYRFVAYVEWPPSSAAAVEDRLTFCILGDDPVAESLERTVRGKSEIGKPLTVHRLGSQKDTKGCAVLFIGSNGTPDLAAVLSSVRTKPILTVGDADDFIRRGGIILFYSEASKLRFEINPDAAEAAGLKLGSRLLSLARIVRRRPPGAP
jgi:YfiR/HmsC-like